MALPITAAMAVAVVGALLPATESAAVYRVGDIAGWTTQVDYGTWASGKEFRVGDQIEFVYAQDSRNVVSVDEESYNTCTLPSAFSENIKNSGDDYYTLPAGGQMFFICSFEELCQAGMRLAVNILP